MQPLHHDIYIHTLYINPPPPPRQKKKIVGCENKYSSFGIPDNIYSGRAHAQNLPAPPPPQNEMVVPLVQTFLVSGRSIVACLHYF